jgi:hypothetical protein
LGAGILKSVGWRADGLAEPTEFLEEIGGFTAKEAETVMGGQLH